ncbi:MAG: hypothetical protein MUF73_18405 [Rhodobacteraceae bacterium]|nr:hypothetical protein [Paracoccaceae bacterium]
MLRLLERLSLAERALARLDGISMPLPRQELFLYKYVRKEAVLSSQIEGTQSTLSDLLRFEIEAQAGAPIDDIREVSNFVDVMMHGLDCQPASKADARSASSLDPPRLVGIRA